MSSRSRADDRAAYGTHTFGSSEFGQIIPQNGDTFIGAPGAILNGEGARFWIVLLVTYDLVFTTSCLLLFETVLNAE